MLRSFKGDGIYLFIRLPLQHNMKLVWVSSFRAEDLFLNELLGHGSVKNKRYWNPVIKTTFRDKTIKDSIGLYGL